ncbi:PH domain-containing protein [Paraglaciecola sp. L3A3]|uniref:PH domain-containing protein n=1 Tax=Paraglaciecola sp. L3A3 TaxID=2686358 RepID=UPI00131BDE6F|nr:PH domain-containing protein [Paraglaciecola sp. L3A3]
MIKEDFSNQTINCDLIPQIEVLEQTCLSDKYVRINLAIHAVVICTILIIGCCLYIQPYIDLPEGLLTALPYITLGVLVLGVLLGYYNYQADLHKRYALRELDLHYSSGLFFRKTVSQPITRIQHIELKRGPIERKTDLASLQVFSAGGAMHTFEIPGLPLTTAQQLRQFILEHKDVAKNG